MAGKTMNEEKGKRKKSIYFIDKTQRQRKLLGLGKIQKITFLSKEYYT